MCAVACALLGTVMCVARCPGKGPDRNTQLGNGPGWVGVSMLFRVFRIFDSNQEMPGRHRCAEVAAQERRRGCFDGVAAAAVFPSSFASRAFGAFVGTSEFNREGAGPRHRGPRPQGRLFFLLVLVVLIVVAVGRCWGCKRERLPKRDQAGRARGCRCCPGSVPPEAQIVEPRMGMPRSRQTDALGAIGLASAEWAMDATCGFNGPAFLPCAREIGRRRAFA